MSNHESTGFDIPHGSSVRLNAVVHSNASNGNYTMGNTSYISKREWFPYCTYELQSLSCLNEIQLVLGKPDSNLLHRFTVLISIDGIEWSSQYSQTKYVCNNNDCQPYTFRFAENTFVKFVKIRLDGYGELNIVECEMKGETETYPLLPQKKDTILLKKGLSAPRVAFSILFTESEEYLLRLIDNFLAYTDEFCFLFINLSPGRVITTDMSAFSHRITVFSGEVQRKKWGHTLLIGHIESYLKSIETVMDLQYFCTLSSNCLFVKSFDIDATLEQLQQKHSVPVGSERNYENDLDVAVGDIPSKCSWMWEHFARSPDMHPLIRHDLGLDHVSATQIEGLFASITDWSMVADRLPVIRRLDPFLKPEFFMALEECLPISIFRRFGSGHYTFICYMLWQGARIATVEEVLNLSLRLPAHLSSLKWFDRNIPAPSTDLVTTPWGRGLVAIANTSRYIASADVIHRRFLLSRVSHWMAEVERYAPLSSRWQNEKHDRDNSYTIALPNAQISRQILPLNDIAEIPPNSGFLFFEATNEIAQITVESAANVETDQIFIASSSERPSFPNTPDHEDVVGYLYLASRNPTAVFRLSFVLGANDDSMRVARRIVLHDGCNYTVVSPTFVEESNGTRYFYFAHAGMRDNVWIGLPVYRNQAVNFGLSILDV